MKNGSSKNSRKFLLSGLLLISLFMSAHGQIAKDKQLHLGAGAVVGGWGYLIPKQTTSWKPIAYGIGTATIAGVGKELTDLGGFGTPDLKDLGATVIGGVVSVGIIAGVKAIIKTTKRNRRMVSYAQLSAK
jgi:hypothetical protein